MRQRFLQIICVLFFLVSLPAFSDDLTFVGGAPPAQNPGYFALVSSSTGSFVLVAPIATLTTGLGGSYTDSAVLALQTGAGTPGNDPNTITYTSGAFALYSSANWNFSTNSGVNPLLTGTLGASEAAYLQPVSTNPLLFATGFAGTVTGGSYFGSFGGYDLTSNGSINNGGVASISIDICAASNCGGVLSVPVKTELIFTPEPASLLLLSVGSGFIFWRRRK